MNHKKRSKKISYIEPEKFEYIPNDTEYDIDIGLLNAEFASEVSKQLLLISEQQAEVFMYKYFSDLDIEEISNLMEISNGNVRILLHRSRRNIKDYILSWRKNE